MGEEYHSNFKVRSSMVHLYVFSHISVTITFDSLDIESSFLVCTMQVLVRLQNGQVRFVDELSLRQGLAKKHEVSSCRARLK